ncbi:hypothetical protein AOXY_G2563 [Acipenser oxyrinchus oxyrinchus]|uniref:Uncharacterized protein n=1 Tax=Acipenser oxyrinchus oxyrinchus TaxID=40147 RepID=A0AAD8GHX9_ACIOX|nr:hypothetical protein AOXY_G2563 [Acipenser oxyrinchus oxyrinchus]
MFKNTLLCKQKNTTQAPLYMNRRYLHFVDKHLEVVMGLIPLATVKMGKTAMLRYSVNPQGPIQQRGRMKTNTSGTSRALEEKNKGRKRRQVWTPVQHRVPWPKSVSAAKYYKG